MRRLVMNATRKRMSKLGLHAQEGAALVIAVMILLVLTVVGIYAVTTSTIETKITGYHKWHVEAFYAADAGLDYALADYPYGSLDSQNPHWDHDATGGDPPKFDVEATYLGNTPPPVGSGTGTRQGFVAHHFRTDSDGEDQAQISSSTVHMWGYRIGF
jgi:hypothetical protein